MTGKELCEIACFLNLAALKIKASAGSIQWLTDQATTIAYENTGQSQETQCLSWGTTVWIANNDDGDTTTQQTLINALGISTAQKLEKLAKSHGKRVFPTHADAIVTGGMSPKQKLLYKLIGKDSTAPGPAAAVGPAADNKMFNITARNNIPPITGIVFIKGSFLGNGGDALHAEQKLLAALGLLCSGGTKPPGEIHVGGVKAACATCKAVLDTVYLRMSALSYGTSLRYECQSLKQPRTDAGIGADGNAGIRSLDVNTYFT